MKLNYKLSLLLIGLAPLAQGVTLQATFTGVGPVAFAPAAIVTHDGSYDPFNAGSAASSAIETIAEVGDPSSLLATAPSSANTLVLTGSSSPPIPVGSSSSGLIDVDTGNDWVSITSMLLPSSDYFIGNDNPMAYDISALLSGSQTSITFTFSTVWDAGTEVNDFLTSPGGGLVGAPAGIATDGVDENGVITAVTGSNPFGAFANAGAFDTTTIDFTGNPVATLTLTTVPEPTSGFLVALAGISFIARRRR